MLVLFALALAAPNVVKKRVLDGSVTFVGALFVDNDLLDMHTLFNTSSDVSFYTDSRVKEFPVYLYTYRMTNLSIVNSGNVVNTDYSLVAPSSLSEFTLLIDVYKTCFVYLGKPPPEMDPHLIGPSCGTPTFTNGLDFSATVGDVPVVVSHSINQHTVSDTGVCGAHNLVFDDVSIPIWIDCTTVIHGSSTKLSGVRLGLGIYSGNGKLCIYRGNNDEINHPLAVTLVAVLFIFLVVWIDFTRNPWTRVLDGTTKGMWETTTVAYSLIVYQFIGIIVSMNIYARAQQSHNIYNFSSLRMLSRRTIDTTADIYSYVLTPVLGGLSLLIMVIGRIQYGPDLHISPFHFTWGFKSLERRPIGIRLVLTFSVLCVIGVIIYAIWIRGIDDETGGIVTAITTVPVVLSWSTPRWVTALLTSDDTGIFGSRPSTLSALFVFFSWGVKVLVITCMCNNLPFDVSGHLNSTFHSGITFALGIAILVITGRDMAHVLMCVRDLGRAKIWTLGLFLSVITGFVLWYASIFNLGGMFSHSGALQNKGELATICSFSFAVFAFSVSFSVSVNDGIAETVTKAKGN